MKFLKVFTVLLFISQSLLSSDDIDTRVWSVIKISYKFSSTGKIHYLPQTKGTAFFIANFYCLTADHLFYDSIPYTGFSEIMYALVNPNGIILGPIDIMFRHKEIDLAVCIVNTQGKDIFIWQCTDKYKKDDDVYNLGFTRTLIDPNWYFKFNSIEPPMELDTAYIHNTEYSGQVVGDDSASFDMKGLTYKNKKFILLNYETPSGCSGGPVILKKTNEVIGIVSFGMGDGHDIAYAISMKEVMPFIKDFISR